MITADGMDALKRLDTDGHLALSLYLDVSTPDRRRRVMQRVAKAIEGQLAAAGNHTAEQVQELQEDIELVRLYFGTSASRRHPYVAIFSCATQLFWRVVPLPEPIAESIVAADSLDVGPLRQVSGARAPVHSRQNELLPHFNCATV
ncbi:MAG: hypothetical protein ACYC5O_08260 [Anaerolineae bacterium]